MRPMCSCSAQAMAADVKRSNAIAIAQAIRPRLLTALARAAALKTDSSVLSGQSLRIAILCECCGRNKHEALLCASAASSRILRPKATQPVCVGGG